VPECVASNPSTPVMNPDTLDDVRLLPPYNVILHDDDDHSFEYVIEMLLAVFGFPVIKGFRHAIMVHNTGRTVLLTTTKEHAEFKQEQVHAYGADYRIPRCQGSMTASIEPVV
jgi:ATP-dependent Clp protease adaptor protein ClpS